MLQQGTDEWRQARCGSVGASDAPRVVRRTKTGYSADRESLMAAKVLERLTGQPVEIFKTQAMLQGTEREPEARMLYELLKGVEVEQVGIVPHPSIKGSHASPDGLVTEIGLVEIKCPQPAAHMDTLMGETISEAHVVQMHWQMACSGSQWCDYVSFNPNFPPAMQVWIRRIYRDAKFIAELEREIAQFIKEIDRKVEQLSRRYAVAA